MATHTNSYKQDIIPPWLSQGLVIGMIAAFLLGGAYTGYLFYYVVKNAVKDVANRTNLPASVPYVELALPIGAIPITGDQNETAPVIVPVQGSTEVEAATGGSSEAPAPAPQIQGRVNILLMGIDKRPDEVYARTDTMILVTLDTNSNQAGMLSVPRDLWVSVPGFDEDRVNKAHFLGDQHGYPGGGPALAMKTIQYNLGVPVHAFVKVDFEGFRNIVDTLGGIEIDVPETIDDPKYPDMNYGYDPFYIEAGQHTLDGYDALRYARTRATPGADFSRAKRQQAVLLAIRDKALQLNMLPKIPELWASMSNTVETSLSLVDILELAQLASAVDAGNIQSAVIGPSMTIDYTVPDTGARVLLPRREKIRTLIDEMFVESEPSAAPAETQQVAVDVESPVEVDVEAEETVEAQARAEEIQQHAEQQQQVKEFLGQEDARLVVQNGTSTPNLASQTALYLKQQGFNIFQHGAADNSTYEHTVIVVYDENKTFTLDVLKAIFEVDEENIRRSPNLKSDLDFRVIIGSDFELQNGNQSPLTTE
jgi:LCP family protein required for cell wall assembly